MKLGMYNKIVFFMMFLSFVFCFSVDVYGLDLSGTYAGGASWTSTDSPINITGDVILSTGTFSIDASSVTVNMRVIV